MDPVTRTRELAARYFDARLSEAELAELQALLQSSDAAADAFARLSRLEGGLRELFAQEQAVRREAGVLDAIDRQQRRRRLLRHTIRVAVAACLLLAVLGPLLWWLSSPDKARPHPAIAVVGT